MAINILEAFSNKPIDQDFVWPGFLAGTVGAMVAPGATGKSFWALQAALAVACNVPGGDLLDLQPSKNGKVFYIAGEDPEPALAQRLYSMGTYLNEEARQAIADNFVIDSVAGKQLNLVTDEARNALTEKCKGCRLIIIDTLSRVHQLDENSNSDMSRLITSLEHIAKNTGAAVLFLHHVNKNSIRESHGDHQHAARGASALIDNARWCGYVAKMTAEESGKLSERPGGPAIKRRMSSFVRFGVSKQNYHESQQEQWYTRATGGVLIPVTLHKVEKTGNNNGGRANA